MLSRFFSPLALLLTLSTLPFASAQSAQAKVLVFGGTGMLGYEIVKALKDQGQDEAYSTLTRASFFVAEPDATITFYKDVLG